ncbi:hypothetical protein HELRODRAFT_90652, partial [Helobdella robusta]|uniref:G-protein coupled receptors family 2 profile 2 domain-containing protein n=1 Tax=Helobdella robusta TaxID=6412 RepID=T1G7T9_HELRO
RYYMAFVTLLWNGVEAHHMFSTIVKVFNSHVRHFARKAAVVTWGFPFALIAATLTVDAKAFDGYYESCTFRL